MYQGFNWCLSVMSQCWTFLQSYTYRGVTIGAYMIGLFILSLLIDRIVG